MSAYARPTSVDEALELLSAEGAAVLAGGTDLAGQIDRGIREPALLVDLQDAGLGGIVADGEGVRIGAMTTLAELAVADLVAPYAVVAAAAGVAASPLLRNQGTLGGNLCQHTRCWYYRGEEWHCWLGGGDTCFAQIGDHLCDRLTHRGHLLGHGAVAVVDAIGAAEAGPIVVGLTRAIFSVPCSPPSAPSSSDF